MKKLEAFFLCRDGTPKRAGLDVQEVLGIKVPIPTGAFAKGITALASNVLGVQECVHPGTVGFTKG